MNILFLLYVFILLQRINASNLFNDYELESINNLSNNLKNNTVALNNETTLASNETTIPMITVSTTTSWPEATSTTNDTVENINVTTNGFHQNFTTKLPKTADIFGIQENIFTSNILVISLWAWILLTFVTTTLTIILSFCFWNWVSKKIIGCVLREKSKIVMP